MRNLLEKILTELRLHRRCMEPSQPCTDEDELHDEAAEVPGTTKDDWPCQTCAHSGEDTDFDKSCESCLPTDDGASKYDPAKVPEASFYCRHQSPAEDGTACCGYGLKGGQVMISCKGKRDRGNCPKPVSEGPESEEPASEQPKPEAKPLEWKRAGLCRHAASRTHPIGKVGWPYTVGPAGGNDYQALFKGTLCTGTLQECIDACEKHEREGQ